MKTIRGYTFNESIVHVKIGACEWCKAKKDGREYFLKKFTHINRLTRGSEAVMKRRNAECDAFRDERLEVMNALKGLSGGVVMAPVDFFEQDGFFWQATLWSSISPDTSEQIAGYSYGEKLIILKTAANALLNVHKTRLVHCDIKPDNLPVAKSPSSKFPVCNLMDFDSSHFEGRFPEGDETALSPWYASPELVAYIVDNPAFGGRVTTASDIFSLGMVMHEYWTGKPLIWDGDDYLYHAVSVKKKISCAPGVPEWLADLFLRMVSYDPGERPDAQEVFDTLCREGRRPAPPAPPRPPAPEPPKPPEEYSSVSFPDGFSAGPRLPSAVRAVKRGRGIMLMFFDAGEQVITTLTESSAIANGWLIRI